MVVLGLITSAAQAATDTVTNANDSGSGSLRAVVAAAAAGDTVNFASGVTGSIALSSGAISIGHDLTIQGPGASTLAIDAGHKSQIFTISGGNVSISGLTLKNGAAGGPGGSGVDSGAGLGGAIDDTGSGSLSVSGSAFSTDTAGGTGGSGNGSGVGEGGAIAATGGGSLSVSESTFTGDTAGGTGGSGNFGGFAAGGAIMANGSVSVSGSTFTGDIAGGTGSSGIESGEGFGGAILANGSVSVSGSTFSGDTAGGAGGGGELSGLGVGGAIDASMGGSLTDSTLVGNTAGGAGASGLDSGNGLGGALRSVATTTLSSVTIDGNSVGAAGGSAGSGVFGAGGMTARATIVSGNTGAPNCDAHVASSDHSLEGPAGSTSCGFDLTSADPLLGPLADNGGPAQTQALGAGSPAIDVVPLANCPTSVDQRGMTRPDLSETNCDVGAFEFQDPIASITGATVTEPATARARTTATFTVTLSHASTSTATVDYQTSDGSAQSPQDYLPASGTLTFAPGETTKTINVTVNGDGVNEPFEPRGSGRTATEQFSVTLTNPTGGTVIGTGTATGTILPNGRA